MTEQPKNLKLDPHSCKAALGSTGGKLEKVNKKNIEGEIPQYSFLKSSLKDLKLEDSLITLINSLTNFKDTQTKIYLKRTFLIYNLEREGLETEINCLTKPSSKISPISITLGIKILDICLKDYFSLIKYESFKKSLSEYVCTNEGYRKGFNFRSVNNRKRFDINLKFVLKLFINRTVSKLTEKVKIE